MQFRQQLLQGVGMEEEVGPAPLSRGDDARRAGGPGRMLGGYTSSEDGWVEGGVIYFLLIWLGFII